MRVKTLQLCNDHPPGWWWYRRETVGHSRHGKFTLPISAAQKPITNSHFGSSELDFGSCYRFSELKNSPDNQGSRVFLVHRKLIGNPQLPKKKRKQKPVEPEKEKECSNEREREREKSIKQFYFLFDSFHWNFFSFLLSIRFARWGNAFFFHSSCREITNPEGFPASIHSTLFFIFPHFFLDTFFFLFSLQGQKGQPLM